VVVVLDVVGQCVQSIISIVVNRPPQSSHSRRRRTPSLDNTGREFITRLTLHPQCGHGTFGNASDARRPGSREHSRRSGPL
jgi:hypothetical protein